MKRIFTFSFILIISATAFSQWSEDPSVNNLLATSGSFNSNIQIISDGSGGAIFSWIDLDSGNFYLQRVNSSGEPQWPSGNQTEGIRVDSLGDISFDPSYRLISDGNSGAILVWDFASEYTNKVFAQRYNSAGAAQWAVGDSGHAVEVSNRASNQAYPKVTTDGSGGAIISWTDIPFTDEDEDSVEVYAQKINSAGIVQWSADGVQVTNTLGINEDNEELISDGSGGAVVIYLSGTDQDVGTQRLNSSGTSQWSVLTEASAFQIPVISPSIFPDMVKAIGDGSGGVIIVWYDIRDDGDLYAQKIDFNGSTPWALNGIPVSTAEFEQGAPAIASDDSGGAIIAWEDVRNGFEVNIFAQKIRANGDTAWTANGIQITSGIEDESLINIINVPGGGVILAFQNGCGCGSDIYAQKINADSTIAWAVNGIGVGTADSSQAEPAIVSDGSDGAIIVWDDYRNNELDGDIYGSHVNSDGSLPVELTSFTAAINGSNVILNWSTATEVSNYGFEVQRSEAGGQISEVREQKSESIELSFETVAFIKGAGNSNTTKSYSFTDENTTNGNYIYRLKQIDNDGSFTYSDIVEVSFMKPEVFTLAQNYPNPFNPETKIEYEIPAQNLVQLKVYDILGTEIKTLVNENKEPGVYTVSFDAANLAAGTYIYRLTAGEFQKTMKMILLK